MKRAIDRVRELLISSDREEYVAGFDRHFIVAKPMVLEDPDMIERAFDQRLRAWLAIFFEQILLQATGIDADADRALVGARRGNHFLDPFFGADVARIDAQAGRAGIRGF